VSEISNLVQIVLILLILLVMMISVLYTQSLVVADLVGMNPFLFLLDAKVIQIIY
jgi:hypothetical protein